MKRSDLATVEAHFILLVTSSFASEPTPDQQEQDPRGPTLYSTLCSTKCLPCAQAEQALSPGCSQILVCTRIIWSACLKYKCLGSHQSSLIGWV